MEELVAVLFQVFFELAIQLFGSSGIWWATGNEKVDKGCAYFFLHSFAGGGLGWVSTIIAPHLVLPYAGLRIANLIVAPLVSGGISYGFARFANSRGQKWDPMAHFLHGAMFAFFFGAARFTFGTH